jgi:hypothetical protein
MTEDRATSLEHRLDAVISGLHKREINDVEMKGELKLLRQSMQSMEAQFVLINQMTGIRIQKLEEADVVLTKKIDDQDTAIDALKTQATKAALVYNMLGVVALAVFNYVWYILTGKS